ncbi:MAG: Smr/MutS family protein [Deltaproteobacteria bacterium]|nr:Smr/MutS family protein [Deltaproteobacteria bacterium]MBW1944339.1 Smr/MutS family protein [Deltaproteobacteria bacterium]MBW2206011.1 Smr/MutS family protein [Deltaproteobacteria bacterium]
MDVVEYPIDGSLDLHMFAPKDVPSVVEEYLAECLKRGIFDVKIVHGKGRGVLRRTVHALLERHPLVQDFKIDSGPSSWGATLVRLKAEQI